MPYIGRNPDKGNFSDLNGAKLILDADADTSITADTDDQIDIEIAGSDVLQLTAAALTTTGTFEPAGDTAAGDNAALGYTSVLGAILTGQGSTNDVTLVNDADATVLSIPTGTTNVDIVGNLSTANINVDNGGSVVVGHTAAVTTTAAATTQILGTGAADSMLTIGRFSADALGPAINFLKSRNASLAGNTIHVDNDIIGTITAHVADGNDFVSSAANIIFEVDDSSVAQDEAGGAIAFGTTTVGASSPTERMRIDSGGGFTLTTSPTTVFTAKRTVAGSVVLIEQNAAGSTNPTMNVREDNNAASGVVLNLNRSASDGDIVTLQHANTTEGTISISGTTVTYGTFTGGHDAQWGADQDPGSEPPVGTLVSTVDELFERVIVESEETIEEEGKDPVTRMKRRRLGPGDTIESGESVVDLPKAQLTKVKISDTQADKRVYGVFGNIHVETGDLNIHALGTSMVRVVGAAAGGDLIQSSATAGVAEKQSDDIIRSSTVGKVARTVAGVGERLVPCTIYCG